MRAERKMGERGRMADIVAKQLALDYCCGMEDVEDGRNHFLRYQPLPGRRRFRNDDDCFLKIAVVNGKLLFAGREDILKECEKRYRNAAGEWFFEAERLVELNELLRGYGYRIKLAHPFYVARKKTAVEVGGYDVVWYRGAEIERFRGDARFDEAFAFCPDAPDEIGVAACEGGRILGMAGASSDSPLMWQIGINVEPEARGRGIAPVLVNLLKNEIIDRGRTPYYGTALSHIASQRTALHAGFLPAWAELATAKVAGGNEEANG